MKYIKDNKFVVLAIAILLVLIILAFQVIRMFVGDTNGAIYGNRLDGMDKVKITSKIKDEVIDNVEKEDEVTKVTMRTSGKIVNIVITVSDETSIETAKSYAEKALEKFSDKQKQYYDFQIFIDKKSDASDFPIIGYKQNKKDGFSWTKDRTAS